MKSWTIFLFIILGCFSLSHSLKVDERLAQIDMTPYGKHLLNTIEVSFKTEGSISIVIDLLNNLAESLRHDQNEDDLIHDQQEQECQQVIDE